MSSSSASTRVERRWAARCPSTPTRPLGAEFPVSSYYTTGFFSHPRVAADGEGNFVVVWQYAASYNDPHVFGRWHDAQSGPVGGEFRVDAATSDQRYPFVAAHEDGNF